MAEERDQEEPRRRVAIRLRLGVGAAVVIALVVLSAVVGIALLSGRAGETTTTIPLPSPLLSAVPDDGGGERRIYVHVLGAVVRPGLYLLDDGARVAEALAVAGGTLPGAELRGVNLARRVGDGEQIVVPAAGEIGPAPASGGSGSPAGPIDLNTADAAALEELPRIGPALAQRIIEWRESNGRFTSVDDLLGVPGIGDKMLAGLRDRVRV